MSRNQKTFVLLGSVIAAAGLLFAALLVSFSASRAAPPQSTAPIEPNQYFPLQVGNQWVYSWTNNIYATLPVVETIVVAEQTDGQYTLHASHSQATGHFKIATSSGYQWTGHGSLVSADFPVPMYLLPYYLYVPENLFLASFQVGDMWSGTSSWHEVPYTGTTTVVTDTATIFTGVDIYTNCLQIRTVVTGVDSFHAGARDAWFAPDVGLVKLVYNHGDGSVTAAELQIEPLIYDYSVFLPLTMKNHVTIVNVFLPLTMKNFVMESRERTTITGEYSIVPNPCTTDPCLPGVVYAVLMDNTYHLTIEGHWLWGGENPSWDGYTPGLGDLVTVTGYVSEEMDIFGNSFYNIEVVSLVPAPPLTPTLPP